MPDTHQPAEQSTFRLRRRTPGSFLLVPCPKQGRSIRCQGQLEAAAAAILVSCPAVDHVQEQPMSIWYQWRHDGNELRVRKLDELMWTFLRLLTIEESLERFLETERREDVPALVKEAEVEAKADATSQLPTPVKQLRS